MPIVKFPSGVGRAGVPGGGKIILSQAEVTEGGKTGALPLVRIQWWNSKGRPTQGAWLDLPAMDMVELAVALLDVAVQVKPELKNDLFGALTRIAALCKTD